MNHIRDSIDEIILFLRGVSESSFLKNKEKQNAVIRSLEVIGEAVKNIPSEFLRKYPSVPWSGIAKMRDKIIHHYFGIDIQAVWKVAKKAIPVLDKEIKEILKKEGSVTPS
ncbi:MAG: DUF86 domain-containing protein [Nanoarchaeota archaeon]|nr:DUF86 domain-containing protein [Nanoarchaeota archaeon]